MEHSTAWWDGFRASLAGLGDPCPYQPAGPEAQQWAKGDEQAQQLIRELPEDLLGLTGPTVVPPEL